MQLNLDNTRSLAWSCDIMEDYDLIDRYPGQTNICKPVHVNI